MTTIHDPRAPGRPGTQLALDLHDPHVHPLTADVDACCSPDEGGWYLGNHRTGEVSKQVWPTVVDARESLLSGEVRWMR